jgi:hypothetical protein
MMQQRSGVKRQGVTYILNPLSHIQESYVTFTVQSHWAEFC